MRLSDIPIEAVVFVDANVPLASVLEEQRADLAEELGTDVTEEHHALIQQLKAKYRHVPRHAPEPAAASES